MEKEMLRLVLCGKRFPALLLLDGVLLRAPLVLLNRNDSDESSEVCCCCCCFCSSEVLGAS